MISVGTRSEGKAFMELTTAAKFLVEKGFIKERVVCPEIQNIVATFDFGKSLDLEKIAETTRGIYEPEQFPGFILQINDPSKATILLFSTGKAVVAGLKSSEQLELIAQKIEATFMMYTSSF